MIDKPWFKSNDYVWSYPSSKEGFLVLVCWVILVAYIWKIIDRTSQSTTDSLLAFSVPLILLIVILIFIFLGTGKFHRSRYINIG